MTAEGLAGNNEAVQKAAIAWSEQHWLALNTQDIDTLHDCIASCVNAIN